MATNRLLHTEIERNVLESIVDPPAKLDIDSLAKFRWSNDYLQIKTLDVSTSMQVEQKVTPSVFESYTINQDGEVVTGINCALLKKYLKNAEENEVINYDVHQNSQRVSFSHISGSFAGVDTDTITEPNIDEFDLPIQVRVPQRVFKESYSIASMFEVNPVINVGNGSFSIRCGQDSDEITLDYDVVEDDSDLDASQPNIAFRTDAHDVEVEISYKLYKHIPDFTPEGYFSVQFGPDSPMVINCNRAGNRIPTKIVVGQRIT